MTLLFFLYPAHPSIPATNRIRRRQTNRVFSQNRTSREQTFPKKSTAHFTFNRHASHSGDSPKPSVELRQKRVTPNIAPFFRIQREFDRSRQDFAAGNRLFKNQNRSKPPVLSASNTRINAERSKNHTSWKGHECLGLQKYRYLINK